jgi:hypothetical protein
MSLVQPTTKTRLTLKFFIGPMAPVDIYRHNYISSSRDSSEINSLPLGTGRSLNIAYAMTGVTADKLTSANLPSHLGDPPISD